MRNWKFAATMLVIALVPCVAQAHTLGPLTTTTPIPSTLTDWSAGLSFPMFNPALGTLNAVQLDFQGSISTVFTIMNTGSSTSNGHVMTEVLYSVQDGGNSLLTPTLDLFTPIFSYSLLPGQQVTSGALTQSGSFSHTYSDAVILAEFTGLGEVVLPASTTTQTWISYTGGNSQVSQVTQADLTGEVTYFYTVPEPATLAVVILGGMALLRRR